MSDTLRKAARWSIKPAKNVETTHDQSINMVRGLVARATTPLLPDDYLKLLNPLWTARELRGEIVSVQRETEDSATVAIKPGWGFAADYRPGQYVGIGLRMERAVALAFLLVDVGPGASPKDHHDHGQGDSRRISVHALGQRGRTGHDRQIGRSQR